MADGARTDLLRTHVPLRLLPAGPRRGVVGCGCRRSGGSEIAALDVQWRSGHALWSTSPACRRQSLPLTLRDIERMLGKIEGSMDALSRAAEPIKPDTDEEVVRRVLAGDVAAFELILRRYNQRLYRVARSIVGDDGEAEDVVQEAYLRAYEHLSQFAGRSSFATWLTRIAVHEASARRRCRQRVRILDMHETEALTIDPSPDAHDGACTRELGDVLQEAIDNLPSDFRLVFTLRLVEGLSTEDAAECLGLSTANVKVRLHRARSQLRQTVERRLGEEVRRLYQFDGERCDRIVRFVMSRLPRDCGPSSAR